MKQSILFNVQPLVINVQLANAIGLNEAIFFQQVHYWLQKSSFSHDGKKYIYNTVKDWSLQFPFWSESTIKRIISSMIESGLIEVKQLSDNKYDRTNYYTINYQNELLFIENAECDIEPIDRVNLNQSIGPICTNVHPKITTEITTDIKDSVEQKRNHGNTKNKPVFTLPEKLNLDAWSLWTEYRKQQGFKPYKQVALGEGAAASKLIELAGGDPAKQLAIVNQSISNQWKGLFTLKTEQQQKSAIRQTGFTASENPSCTVVKI